MDTSETYAKMMVAAWPDLKGDVPIGAMLFSRRQRMLCVLGGKVVTWRGNVFTSNHEQAAPLLEQDQLQRILWDNDEQQAQPATMLFIMLDGFPSGEGIDYRKTGNNYYRQFTSMEQLWLAFVLG